MKMTKKLVALSLISLTGFSSIGSSFGYVSDETYSTVDKFVEKYSNNTEALQKVEDKVSKAKEKYDTKSYYNLSEKERDFLDILNYINDKVSLSKSVSKYQNTLTADETKKVEDEIVKLQLNLLDTTIEQLKIITDRFEKETSKVEKGNMKINLNLDKDDLGTLKSSLNFNDYTATTSGFDSQLNGELVGLIDSKMKGEQAFKLKLSAFVDFISKDGNTYLLLEKLNIIEKENLEKMQENLDQLEKIATQNKYITIPDKSSEMILGVLKNMSPEKLLSDGKITLGKSLFTAYKKDGDKYYLVPSKYGCDTAKATGSSLAMIYGFGGGDTTCSDNEYKEMLKGFSNSNASVYIVIGDKTKLGFENNENDVKLNGYIVSSGKDIEELDFNVIPNQEIDKDEGFTLNYKKYTSLVFKMYADKGNIDFKFDSKLDKDDRYTYIDYNGNITDSEDSKFESVLKLENNKLNGSIKINEYSNIFNLNIDGTTNTENVTDSLNIDYNLENSNNDILKGKFNYLNNVFSFENTTSDDYENTNIKIGGTYNPSDENLSALNIDLSVKSKSYGKDDFVENFKTNIILKDTIISGYALLKDEKGKDVFAVKTNGKYEKNYLELNNKVAFYDVIKTKKKKDLYLINANIKTDLRNNKNDSNIYIDANLTDKKVFDLEIDNKGTREYKKSEIIAPTNTIDIKELLPSNDFGASPYDDYGVPAVPAPEY